MKTLVIHPKDPTTDFLSEIYKGKDWEVITTDQSNNYLIDRIKSHDRIIMLGHGTEHGLIGFGRFFIDSFHVLNLKKKECVSIWCNANVFFEKYKLKGFYSGMIISEYEEAVYCSITEFTIAEITFSNELFARTIAENANSFGMLEKIKSGYNAATNNIIKFNKNNLFVSGDSFFK